MSQIYLKYLPKILAIDLEKKSMEEILEDLENENSNSQNKVKDSFKRMLGEGESYQINIIEVKERKQRYSFEEKFKTIEIDLEIEELSLFGHKYNATCELCF